MQATFQEAGMRPGKRMLISAALVVGLLVLGWFAADHLTVAPPNPPDPYCSSFGPAALEPPAPLTFEQAQARTSYAIPLPEGLAIQGIWASDYRIYSPETPARRSVRILFDNDLELEIHPSNNPPDWYWHMSSMKGFKKVDVNGAPGVGTSAGFTLLEVLQGKECPRRGVLYWWAGKLEFKLRSDTLSLGELLRIACSMQPDPLSE